MTLTYTPPPELGTSCPEFNLLGVDGKKYSNENFVNHKPLVVMFICNHCPYVKAVEDRLLQLGRDFIPQGVNIVAICSNDAEDYPEDSFENLKKRWKEKNYPFPYLYDETQEIAKLFGAVCTPDFFVYDKDLKLAYRGRLDDSWKEPDKVTHQDLKEALSNLLSGLTVESNQISSMGCSIKWKK